MGKDKHPVFVAVYLLTKGQTSILYSGDTTVTEAIWSPDNSVEELDAVFVETSFSVRFESLTQQTGHLESGMLIKELDKLDKLEVPVKIFYMKPQYLE